ncbi:MAG: hypothetical protein WCP32_04640 [Bacteroidota bacterium]
MCGKIRGVWIIFSLLVTGATYSQNLVFNDKMTLVSLKDFVAPGVSLIRFRFSQDLEYSLTCSNVLFFNWQQDNGPGQISFLQRLNYRTKFTNERNLQITNVLAHDLGMQFFFDSISRFYPDASTLDTKVEVKPGRRFTIFFSSRLATRIFNAYDFAPDDSGIYQKILNSSFLTPLICNFSAGIGWNNPRFAVINIGLSGAKLTYVWNKDIYAQLKVEKFFGVPANKDVYFEYGLTAQIVIDQNFLKRVHWNCDMLVFKNFEKPIDLTVKNLIEIKINKFIKGSIQTKLLYEEEVSRRLQIENLISVGFCVKL